MDFFDFAKIVFCVVLVLAPICIYIRLKMDSEASRRAFQKRHRFRFDEDDPA